MHEPLEICRRPRPMQQNKVDFPVAIEGWRPSGLVEADPAEEEEPQ